MKRRLLCIALLLFAITSLADSPATRPSTVSRDEFDRLVRLVELQQKAIAAMSAKITTLQKSLAQPTIATSQAADAEEQGPYEITKGMSEDEVERTVGTLPKGHTDQSGGRSWSSWEFRNASSGRVIETLTVYYRDGKVTGWYDHRE